MTVQKQINDILDRCHALNMRIETSDQISSHEIDRATQTLEEEIATLSRAVGEGLHPGKAVSWPVGDGAAQYLVGRVNAHTVKLYHVPLGDAWRSPVVDDQGLALRSTVEQRIEQEEGLAKIFGRGSDLFGRTS